MRQPAVKDESWDFISAHPQCMLVSSWSRNFGLSVLCTATHILSCHRVLVKWLCAIMVSPLACGFFSGSVRGYRHIQYSYFAAAETFITLKTRTQVHWENLCELWMKKKFRKRKYHTLILKGLKKVHYYKKFTIILHGFFDVFIK